LEEVGAEEGIEAMKEGFEERRGALASILLSEKRGILLHFGEEFSGRAERGMVEG
jgi:hypothetical protein